MSPRSLIKLVAHATGLYVVRPLRDAVRTVARRHPVRIFTFHRVTTLCRDGMTVAPDVFREQIAYVSRFHTVVPLNRALAAIRSGERLRRPMASITFDDGYRSVFQRAFPIMQSAGVSGCAFVCTDLVGTQQRFPHDEGNAVREWLQVMTWQEIHELREGGWSIGAHSASHARLSDCTAEELVHELESPLLQIRKRTGESCEILAYPFGGRHDMSSDALASARRVGYTAVFSDYGGENFPRLMTDPFQLNRIDIGGNHDRLGWKLRVHGMSLSRLGGTWDRSMGNALR